MKRRSQSGLSNFCPELRKNALLISQSYFSNFALHMIRAEIRQVFEKYTIRAEIRQVLQNSSYTVDDCIIIENMYLLCCF